MAKPKKRPTRNQKLTSSLELRVKYLEKDLEETRKENTEYKKENSQLNRCLLLLLFMLTEGRTPRELIDNIFEASRVLETNPQSVSENIIEEIPLVFLGRADIEVKKKKGTGVNT